MTLAALLLAGTFIGNSEGVQDPAPAGSVPKAGTYRGAETAQDGAKLTEWVLTLKAASNGQFEITGSYEKSFVHSGEEPKRQVSGTLTKNGKVNAISYEGTNKNFGTPVNGRWDTSEGGGILIDRGDGTFFMLRTDDNIAGKWKAKITDPYASYTFEWNITKAGENKWNVKHKLTATDHEYNKKHIGDEWNDIKLTTGPDGAIEFLRTGGDGNPANAGSFRQEAKGGYSSSRIAMDGTHDGPTLDHEIHITAEKLPWAPPKTK